ncbi:hypothetical protein NMG29_06580 [Streptomyces cocklensis]|uniref:Uncharacterized protein n=1 Tax=Actinacidiphila cocklensis TaxID=887465 RepID=A0A9W4GPQ9_9ACTN|nr:hypothetical protein [Actinacidiphila cocklensis]MDD1057897.1 hypothetical protein [Actinacidiphila cocklensis]CAG6392760.1 conserved hypothetical protein [Actinacidiphila cocklensis]
MEKPQSPGELYLARGDEVSAVRPILTGDVFADVNVCDTDGSTAGRAVMILDHPCSLRLDGTTLAPRLTVAEVQPGPIGSWRGSYNRMFLPDLPLGTDPGEPHAAAYFDNCFQVTPQQLEAGNRLACLSTEGINLLLQRRVHHFSRVVIPTFEFQNANAGVYEEADLLEEWCELRERDGVKTNDAAKECMEWLREQVSGGRRQDLLKDPQKRSAIRREMRARIRSLGPHS